MILLAIITYALLLTLAGFLAWVIVSTTRMVITDIREGF